jgi:hypothetical protein
LIGGQQANLEPFTESQWSVGAAETNDVRQFLDAGDSVYRGRIENRIRHRNSLPSSVEA